MHHSIVAAENTRWDISGPKICIKWRNTESIHFSCSLTYWSVGDSQVALVVKNSPANAGRSKRLRFNPWVQKISWRRAWPHTPVFVPGESNGQRNLDRLQSIGLQSQTQLKGLSRPQTQWLNTLMLFASDANLEAQRLFKSWIVKGIPHRQYNHLKSLVD